MIKGLLIWFELFLYYQKNKKLKTLFIVSIYQIVYSLNDTLHKVSYSDKYPQNDVSVCNKLELFLKKVIANGIKSNWHKDKRNTFRIKFLRDWKNYNELFLCKNKFFQFYFHFIISLTLPTTSLSRITLIPYGWVDEDVKIFFTIPFVNFPVFWFSFSTILTIVPGFISFLFISFNMLSIIMIFMYTLYLLLINNNKFQRI